MSPRTNPASYAPLFTWLTEQGRTPDPGFITECQDLYSRGMDQALGIQETSFDTAVQLHSQALDLCKDTFRFTPALNNLFEMSAQFLASCMEFQLQCLTMMVPGIPVASSSAGRIPPTAEGLEHGMDITVGHRRHR